VLPPQDALYDDDATYGEVRQAAAGAAAAPGPVTIGCPEHFRQLEVAADSCAENEIWCWMRCMPHTEEHSPEACAAKDMGFNCTSMRDQIWPYCPPGGFGATCHGDYWPQCTNSETMIVPDFVSDPLAPKQCAHGFEEFLNATAYANHLELVGSVTAANGHTNGGGHHRQLWDTADQKQELHLLWEVEDCKTLHAKLVFNDHLSWISMGIPHPTGAHNGMNGARIVLGVANSGYWEYGEFKEVPQGAGSYIIHERSSSFRSWAEPIEDEGLLDAKMEINDCFSALEFSIDMEKGILGWPIKAQEKMEFLWGGHSDTTLVGYHGRTLRGKFDLDLSSCAADPAPTIETETPEELSGAAVLRYASVLLVADGLFLRHT